MNTNEVNSYCDYEISSAQKRMYVLDKISGNNSVYNMFSIIKFDYKIDMDYLQEVWNKVVARHESLRTSFNIQNDSIVQRVHKNVNFKLEHIKAENQSIQEQCKNFIRPFSLETAPLMRVGILECDEQNFMVIDMHHIISDGVSENILVDDFNNFYHKKELPELTIQYKDYSQKQNLFERSDKIERYKKFWLEQFSGGIQLLSLPTDYPRPELQQFDGDSMHFKVNHNLTQKIEDFCEEYKVTMNVFLMTVYAIMLHKLSEQEDIIIGTPISARRNSELSKVIGMFINTVPIRCYPKKEKKFIELLNEVKRTFFAALKYQDYTIDMLLNEIKLPKDLSRNPLVDAAFLFNSSIVLDGELSKKYYKTTVAKSDISIEITQSENEIKFILEYCKSLFTEATCRRFGNLFISLLEQITYNPESLIKNFTTISEEEKNKVLYKWNSTERNYNKLETIVHLLEKQVKQTPNKIALSLMGESISYEDLNKYVNQFAVSLREKGVERENIIAIMMEPCLDMVIGILGIIKAGGAYLPIEKKTPKDRVKYIIEDSGAKYLISDEHTFNNTIIYNRFQYAKYPDENLEVINQSSDLLYVIYTSGSTGNPKGVMVQHYNVGNFIYGIDDIMHLTDKSKILLLTTACFDISVLEMIVPLTLGMEVVIATKELQTDMRNLLTYIKENQIDVLQSTPSRIQMLTLFFGWENVLCNVKNILIGGESFSDALLDKLSILKDTKIYNMYGPTETTIWSTVAEMNANKKITIGRPIANTHIYILNKSLEVVTAGEVGEICIAGDGVTRGYLNRPELNSERFVINTYTGELMYRTGDLGKWLENGEIEYLGRVDFQVKIRGYRIEVGEIEHYLLKLEEINQAVVVDFKNDFGNEYLCAYMTGKQKGSVEEVREYLQGFLPEYMIPSYFVFLDQMPLNNNGKVDRSKLPKPSIETEKKKSFIYENNVLAKDIKEVWEEVLGLDEINENKDFFAMGGNSLLAIKADVMFEEKKIPINSKLIYKLRTIANLVDYLENNQELKKAWAIKENINITEDEDATKIKDIEPFNELFFESCFYNSLFSILNYYNVELNSVVKQYSYNYKLNTDDDISILSVDGEWKRDIVKILEEVNIRYYCNTPKLNILCAIKDAINRNHPVVLWIDCYYESCRKDKYQREHFQHTITIWGYNEKTKMFYILEHENVDSLYYNKVTIPYDELLNCYEGYLNNFYSGEMNGFYEFYLEQGNIEKSEEADLFSTSHWDCKLVQKFVDELNSMAFSEINVDKIAKLLDGMNQIVNAKRIEVYKLQRNKEAHIEDLETETQILTKWEEARSFIGKSYFKRRFTETLYLKLIDCIINIIELEKGIA